MKTKDLKRFASGNNYTIIEKGDECIIIGEIHELDLECEDPYISLKWMIYCNRDTHGRLVVIPETYKKITDDSKIKFRRPIVQKSDSPAVFKTCGEMISISEYRDQVYTDVTYLYQRYHRTYVTSRM